MPHGVHRIQARTFRPDPVLYANAKKAVEAVDSTMNEHLVAFLQWLTHETEELPARPDRALFADSR